MFGSKVEKVGVSPRSNVGGGSCSSDADEEGESDKDAEIMPIENGENTNAALKIEDFLNSTTYDKFSADDITRQTEESPVRSPVSSSWKHTLQQDELTQMNINFFDIFSLSTIYKSYSFKWMILHTKGENTMERMVDNQASIALLSALLLTVWMSLLYQTYTFKESWQDTVVGFGLCFAVVFHFLSMVNSVILGMMFSSCKTSGSHAGNYLLQTLGSNSLAPMIQFYVGCFGGGIGMLVIIYLNYLKLTFYMCATFFVLCVFGVNAVFYQYNVLAFYKAIELDRCRLWKGEKKKKAKSGSLFSRKREKHKKMWRRH